ncbi:MAG: RNA polymerase sigma factor [Planctomycetes bacterium]|nr:RNA polymerase sigma factor [Planctomycetota bacterium]
MDPLGSPRAAAPAAAPRFDAVYRDYARTVHGVVLAIVGPDDCDDVAQETFLAVHRGLDTLRDPAALPGWLCRIARNTAREHLRRRGRTPVSEDVDPDAVAAPAPSGGELARRVLQLVMSLPEAYREPLVLRLVEGLSGPEIAARTGHREGSLRVNLCRGMALLRPLLRKEGWP